MRKICSTLSIYFSDISENVDLEQVRLGCNFLGLDEIVYSDIIMDKAIFNFNIKEVILSPEYQPMISRPGQYSLAIFLKSGTFKKGSYSSKIQIFDSNSNGSLILESNTLDKEASNSTVLKFILKVDETVFKYTKGYVILRIALNDETEIETHFNLPIEINLSNSIKPMKRKSHDCHSNAQDFPEAKVSKHASSEQSRSEDFDVENLFQMNLDHMQPLANDIADPQLVQKLQRENEQLQEENVQLKRKLNDENLFQMNLDHMQPLANDLADSQLVQKLPRENEQLKRKLKSLRSKLGSRSIGQIQFVLSLPEQMKGVEEFHLAEYFIDALGWMSKKDVEHFIQGIPDQNLQLQRAFIQKLCLYQDVVKPHLELFGYNRFKYKINDHNIQSCFHGLEVRL